jgi:hypothetical protein
MHMGVIRACVRQCLDLPAHMCYVAATVTVTAPQPAKTQLNISLCLFYTAACCAPQSFATECVCTLPKTKHSKCHTRRHDWRLSKKPDRMKRMQGRADELLAPPTTGPPDDGATKAGSAGAAERGGAGAPDDLSVTVTVPVELVPNPLCTKGTMYRTHSITNHADGKGTKGTSAGMPSKRPSSSQ